jgi:hypothetical protein
LKWLYWIVGGPPKDRIDWVLFPFVLVLTSVTCALVVIVIGPVLWVALSMIWLFKHTLLGRGTAPTA